MFHFEFVNVKILFYNATVLNKATSKKELQTAELPFSYKMKFN